MRTALVVGALTLLCATANAQVTIDPNPFTGTDQEGFELGSGTSLPCVPYNILNGQGTLCTPGGNGVYMTGGWSYACSLPKHSGTKMCGTGGATGGGGILITFFKPVSHFGGYFGMNHTGSPDFTVWMYAGPTLVYGPVVIQQACDCVWYWRGWKMNGVAVDSILLKSNHSSTGYLHMDDFEADFNTQVTPYGTGCAGAGGFVPELNMSGTPNVGNQVSLDLNKGLGGVLSALLITAASGSVPLGGGCTLLVAGPPGPIVLFIPLGGSGAGNGSYQLPAVIPVLSPVTLYMQAFVNDPAGPIGLSVSNGLKVDIK